MMCFIILTYANTNTDISLYLYLLVQFNMFFVTLSHQYIFSYQNEQNN